MENAVAKKKIDRLGKLKSNRGTTDTYWQQIADYILPSREVIMKSPVPGRKKNGRIFDTTGMWANEQLAGALQGMLTTGKWFGLKFSDSSFSSEAGTLWLSEVERVMYNLFNAPSGRFDSQCHEMFLELSAFGQGVFYEEYNQAGRFVSFRSYAAADCYIDEDEGGLVNTLYRLSPMGAGDAVALFGDSVSPKISEAAKKDPLCTVKILHTVEPRRDGTSGAYKTRKPYESCYIDFDNQVLMAEGGYDTFPYQTPRFSKRTGEVYGFGPGGAALPEVLMVNEMMEVTLRGAEKMVDPPLLLPSDGVIEPITLQPGGLNYYDGGAGEIKPLLTNGRPDFAYQAIEMIHNNIVRHFYVDWLNLPQRPGMTATEVLQRRDERLRLLGPMIARLQTEFLGPLIDRTWNIGLGAGMFPPVPDEIKGQGIDVEYTSPLAQAQRMGELDSIMRAVGTASALASFDPSVMTNFNMDEIVRYSAVDVNNIPAKLLRSKEDVAEGRKQNSQKAAAMEQAQLAVETTKAKKQNANADKFAVQAQAGG